MVVCCWENDLFVLMIIMMDVLGKLPGSSTALRTRIKIAVDDIGDTIFVHVFQKNSNLEVVVPRSPRGPITQSIK